MRSNRHRQPWLVPLQGICACLPLPALYVVRWLLDVPTRPLAIHAGWKPFCGWLLIYVALVTLVVLFGVLSRWFAPQRDVATRPPDLYTDALAEMRAIARMRADLTHTPDSTAR